MHEGVAQEGIIHYARFNYELRLQTLQKKKKMYDMLQSVSVQKRDGTTRLCVNGERDAAELAVPAF